MEEERNMDTMMSKKELKEFSIEKGFHYEDGEDDHRMDIEQIKLSFGIKNKIRFRTCKEYSNSSITWVNANENSTGKLLMLRISTHTLKKVVKGRNIGTEFDLLTFKYNRSGNTSQDVEYDEYHITAHNEFDPYDEPDDPDPTGELQNDARREMFGGYDNGDWGGLYGEEADLGRWNTD
ncbi:hypothetical protein [Winogradskyella sp.]|uniref:hypothetical protein n=1 Tax=Winogradskyella sp. TaxID=1883156 RepID=UPI003AB30177